MEELDTRLHRHFFHQQMRRGAGPGVRVRKLAGIGARIVDQLAKALEWRIRAHHHAEGVTGDPYYVAEVLERLPVDRALVRQAIGGDRELRERVAVGPGEARHLRRPDHAAAAGLVLDDDRLAEIFLRDLGEFAQVHVGRAARRPRTDQRNGLCRKGLRPYGRNERRERDRRESSCCAHPPPPRRIIGLRPLQYRPLHA